MRVALVGIAYSPSFREGLQLLFDSLCEIKAEIHIYTQFYKLIKGDITYRGEVHLFSEIHQLPSDVDYFFSIGGDGTLLHTVSIVKDSGIPILGINTGRLGYLTSASLSEAAEILKTLQFGTATEEKRSLLKIDTETEIFGESKFALNDFTIHKRDSSSMIIVHAKINGVFLNSYWGDGLIIATPTGSTAYSLSCGGPIVAPDCDLFVITPISPHNLNVRPLVVSSDSVITLTAETRHQNYLAALDSRSVSIDAPIEFHIRKETFTVNIIKLPGQNFPATIRGKLFWGTDKRN
jgi:NAD+ kinase